MRQVQQQKGGLAPVIFLATRVLERYGKNNSEMYVP